MNARVGKSADILHTLGYARNREKDGGILLGNYTDLYASPEEQARDWTATANGYRTQCYTVVVSFTPRETSLLRSMPDNGRGRVRTIIADFLNELSLRGNDVSECPYIVARHDNTDNEHYHIVIRTTDIDGKRFCDRFINKNANRAAACVAMRHGLDVATKAAEREKAHQEAEGKRRKERHQRQHSPSTTQFRIDEKMRRKRAAEEARRRKASLRYIIEKAAREPGNFVSKLTAEGLVLFKDSKKGMSVRMTDTDGKERHYSLQKDLGIDISILPTVEITSSETTHSTTKKETTSSSKNRAAQYYPLKSESRGRVIGKTGDTSWGNSRNAEHEVLEGRNPDDPDEEWKRRNGYKI